MLSMNDVIKNKLEEMTKGDSKVRSAVAEIILEEGADDYEAFIRNVLEHGCISGYVSALIYYTDTEKFAKEHIEEILEALQEDKEEFGEMPIPNERYDLNLNSLAWYIFERVTNQIFNECEC